MHRRAIISVAGAFLLAGCAETHLGPADGASLDEPPSLPNGVVLAEVACSVDLVARTMSCGPEGSSGAGIDGVAAADPGPVIIGGQHRFVRIDVGEEGMSVNTLFQSPLVVRVTIPMTVQNLTLQPWDDVRVFFKRGPESSQGTGIVLSGHTGVDVFIGDEPRPYIGFADLGVLEPGETTEQARQFELTVVVITQVEFGLLIHAIVPDPDALTVRFVDIAAGRSHACGVASNGKAYCWGDNSAGQLGDGSGQDAHIPTPVQSNLVFDRIAAGGDHTCALTTDGKAYCWGSNSHGQLGVPIATTSSSTPVEVDGGHTFAGITAGARHTCGWTDDGDAYCWGDNEFGQLGFGESDPAAVPDPRKVDESETGALHFTYVFAGEDFTCGIANIGATQGAAYCWGNDLNGRFGTGESGDGPRPRPTEGVTGDHAFVTGDASSGTACAIADTGQLYCWGQGGYAQLTSDGGSASASPVAIAGMTNATAVAVGGRHVCAVNAGALYCWGSNEFGQVGNPDADDPSLSPQPVRTDFLETFGPGVVPIRIAAGANDGGGLLASHTCALNLNGPAFCWGSGADGQLGAGVNPTSVSEPVWVAATR